MGKFKDLYLAYMDANGIKYTDRNENTVRVSYTGDNLKTIPVIVIFDDDGDGIVALRCWEIADVPAEKFSDILAICNELNNKFRWVKFSIDKDNDIVASLDAYIDETTCGEECASLVRRMIGIVDEAYPDIMKGLWG